MKTTLFSSQLGDVPANLAFTNNFAATTNPGVTNDSSQGYSVGSSWINVTSDTAFLCVDSTVGAAIWGTDSQGTGLGTQVAPVPHDTAAVLAPSDLAAGIITSNPASAINLQLPLAAAMDAAFPASVAGSSIDFSVISTAGSTNIPTITTNTGWTLVGSMVPTSVAGTAERFRARKTGAGAWTLYRIS